MRILAIYRHYWPDATPYARLLRAILEDQVAQGREATVFTAQPSYNDINYARQQNCETLGGVAIRRIRLLPERKRMRLLRVINYCYFLLRSLIHVLRLRKYDLIIANTHPPILIGLVLRLIYRLKGIPYVLHYQDIHPESAVLAGQLEKGWLARTLLRIDSKSSMSAEGIVTLSDAMKRTLLKRSSVDKKRIKVINNFPLDIYQEVKDVPEVFVDSDKSIFRVLFAGNMGPFQDLPRLVEAAVLLERCENLQFIFMGAGAELPRLRAIAGRHIGKSIFFEKFQPVEVAFECMKKADLGVVSLSNGICDVAYPSKTMTYLAAGCPLLALTESNSQLAMDVLNHDFGYVPADTTREGIAETIKTAVDERCRWDQAAREDLIKRGEAIFGRQSTLAVWREYFDGLENVVLNNSLRSEKTASPVGEIAA